MLAADDGGAAAQPWIEPPAKRARVPDLDTGVNAMLGEILSHELPPLDDGSLDGSLDVLRHEPPSLSTDLDFFLTNLETEIESTPSASPSVSPPLPLQPPAALPRAAAAARRRRRRQPQGLGAVGGRGDPQLRRVEGAARDRGDAPRPLRRRGAPPLRVRVHGRRAAPRTRRRRRRRRLGAAAAAAPRQPNPKREQRQSWTAEEDAIISQSVGEAGNRWSLIVTRLPNRTEHAIRNRWHRLQQMGAGAAGDAAVDASIAGALC